MALRTTMAVIRRCCLGNVVEPVIDTFVLIFMSGKMSNSGGMY